MSAVMQESKMMETCVSRTIKEEFGYSKSPAAFWCYLRERVSDSYTNIQKNLASNLSERHSVPIGSVMPSPNKRLIEETLKYHPLRTE